MDMKNGVIAVLAAIVVVGGGTWAWAAYQQSEGEGAMMHDDSAQTGDSMMHDDAMMHDDMMASSSDAMMEASGTMMEDSGDSVMQH